MEQIFNYFVVLLIIYIIGVIIAAISGIILEDSSWEYAESKYILLYPVIPFNITCTAISKLNNHIIKYKLNQMNLKILGKAMGFMFLPTLGVLLMLLVGFFDPIAMWDFIKSDSGWAIFTRIFLFIGEVVLVLNLYFYYLKQDRLKNLSANKTTTKEKYKYDRSLYQVFPDNDYDYEFFKFATEDPNIIIIERINESKNK